MPHEVSSINRLSLLDHDELQKAVDEAHKKIDSRKMYDKNISREIYYEPKLTLLRTIKTIARKEYDGKPMPEHLKKLWKKDNKAEIMKICEEHKVEYEFDTFGRLDDDESVFLDLCEVVGGLKCKKEHSRNPHGYAGLELQISQQLESQLNGRVHTSGDKQGQELDRYELSQSWYFLILEMMDLRRIPKGTVISYSGAMAKCMYSVYKYYHTKGLVHYQVKLPELEKLSESTDPEYHFSPPPSFIDNTSRKEASSNKATIPKTSKSSKSSGVGACGEKEKYQQMSA